MTPQEQFALERKERISQYQNDTAFQALSRQWLQESIEQRRNTLEKVTKAIIRHQRAFLDKGVDFVQADTLDELITGLGATGFWKLNESSGTTAFDSSGQSNDLTTGTVDLEDNDAGDRKSVV